MTLLLAVVLAAIGTIAVVAYTSGANKRALQGLQAVSVLVAGQQIPAGTSAGALQTRGMVHSEKLPASSVPANALASLAPALDSLVTTAAIQSGQVLLRPMLGTSAPVTGGLPIPAGMVAVSINICEPEDVAGFVHSGSEVAVFNTQDTGSKASLSAGAECSGTHAQQTGTNSTVVAVPKALVLAVGPAPVAAGAAGAPAGGGSSSAGTTTLVTLAVNQTDAQKLILLNVTGLPYLALLTPDSSITPGP